MAEDRQDAQIRELVAELVSSAPPAPPFRQIAERLEQSDVPDARGADAPGLAVVELTDSSNAAAPYVKEATNRRPGRTKPWRLMAALVAMGLATAGGLFAYGSLSADDGSGTPEQAVRQFVDAFQASDPAGMLEALPPSERVVLRESLESLNSQGSRLRLTKDLDLKKVSGVRLEVSGLRLSTTGLSPDVAAVNVMGTVHSTANDRELPLGDVARDVLVDSLPDRGYQGWADSIDEAINQNTSGGNAIRLVTVKEDGGWHVSVWYTLAEYLRRNTDAPLPNFGHSPIKPRGAESPEVALKALLETSGDYSKAVALAAPDESRVLYDYVPGFAATARRNSYYGAVDTRVDKLTTHVEGDGERRVVHLDTYDLSWTTSYSDDEGTGAPAVQRKIVTTVRFDGDCMTTASKDPNRPSGTADSTTSDLPETQKTCRTEAVAKGIELEWDMATAIQVTVERHDGKWFVSPVRSLVGQTVARLARVPNGKAFTRLTSGSDGRAASVLLPIDLLEVAFGSPYLGPWQVLSMSESSSSGSDGSDDSSSGPTPTTSLGPTSSVPATTAPARPTTTLPFDSATTAPPASATTAPPPGN